MFRFLLFPLCLIAAVAAQAAPFKLVVDAHSLEVVPGRTSRVVTMNGAVPGPVLRLREGEMAEIEVENRLKGKTSIHWHGLLLDGSQDGSPGFNGFDGIPGESRYTYRFPVRQSGTYWYHAHSLDEQAGQYAALIIDPAGEDPIVSDREHVILISDHHETAPERILNNLKVEADYYNWNQRTFPEMLRDVGKFGLGKTLADRASWGTMRMDPTDISDVSGYALLLNGQTSARKPWLEAQPGERVRLRLINGSAMSFVDVRIPGVTMEIVASDGRRVEPVRVDELRIGVAETYDVIVTIRDDRPADGAVPLWIETMDRKASVLASLAPRAGMAVAQPEARPRQILLAGEMGHDMGDMDMASGDCTPEHAAMGHCVMAGAAPAPAAAANGCTPEHAAMGHCEMPKAAAAPAMMCTAEHAAMGHCEMASQAAVREGSAVVAGGDTPYPRVDYGYGSNAMAGMDHGELAVEGAVDGSGRVMGWATGAPRGARVLSMRDLVRAEPADDVRAPTREIEVRLTGNMVRYMWSLNGKRYGEADPIVLEYGERVRITFKNETMMAHPMHLHGLFFEVENGQPMDKLPSKNVIVVAPGRTQSILLTANEPGEWPLHCHLLYHMASGMMNKLIVASADGSLPTPTQHIHN
jgi:CopA family copper-resistance protein